MPPRRRASDSGRQTRRPGFEAWKLTLKRGDDPVTYGLPVSLNAGVYGAVIDDETLPEGDYTVRAHVIDVAGNERTVEGPLLRLPARIGTSLAVGKRARRVRGVGANKRRYVLVAQCTCASVARRRCEDG